MNKLNGILQSEADIRSLVVSQNQVQQRYRSSFLTCLASKAARRFHTTFPGYRPTRLVRLKALAQELGVGEIYVKDESERFGLNAFKGLGGSYAIARVICKMAGLDIEDVSCQDLVSKEVKAKIGKLTFATATAGNHGKGVAWAAQQLGHESVVYVPKGTAHSRVKAIEALGARVQVTPEDYDDTVRICVRDAKAHDWVVIQDTAWEGYTQIPKWVMQGYTTVVAELQEQLAEQRCANPNMRDNCSLLGNGPGAITHMFLQAGVGGMAAAVSGCYADCQYGTPPFTIVVEPDRAACMLVSATRGDGKAHSVSEDERGDLMTMMAGLACGEPNPLAWEVLRNLARAYIACPDKVSEWGMQILGRPLGDDLVVVSGESGAVGIGLLWILCKSPQYLELRRKLELNENSRIVFISTEGDTDPVNYRRIMTEV